MREGFRLRKLKNERHDLVGNDGFERMRFVELDWRLERSEGADFSDSGPASIRSLVTFLATSSYELMQDDLIVVSLLGSECCAAAAIVCKD